MSDGGGEGAQVFKFDSKMLKYTMCQMNQNLIKMKVKTYSKYSFDASFRTLFSCPFTESPNFLNHNRFTMLKVSSYSSSLPKKK